MSQQLQTHLIAAAIGATIGVISAASIFIYQKVLEKRQHSMKNAHLDEVDRRLAELQEELERLRYIDKCLDIYYVCIVIFIII